MAPKLKVACAIIINYEGEILLAQRSAFMKHALQWEFPGGKIKAGENSFKAIKREINEELNVSVSTKHLLKIIEWNYGDTDIELQAIVCELKSENFVLAEHNRIDWFSLEELKQKTDLLSADKEFLKDLSYYLQD